MGTICVKFEVIWRGRDLTDKDRCFWMIRESFGSKMKKFNGFHVCIFGGDVRGERAAMKHLFISGNSEVPEKVKEEGSLRNLEVSNGGGGDIRFNPIKEIGVGIAVMRRENEVPHVKFRSAEPKEMF